MICLQKQWFILSPLNTDKQASCYSQYSLPQVTGREVGSSTWYRVKKLGESRFCVPNNLKHPCCHSHREMMLSFFAAITALSHGRRRWFIFYKPHSTYINEKKCLLAWLTVFFDIFQVIKYLKLIALSSDDPGNAERERYALKQDYRSDFCVKIHINLFLSHWFW